MIVTLDTNLLAQWLGLYVCPGRPNWTCHLGQGRLHRFGIIIELYGASNQVYQDRCALELTRRGK